MKTTGEGSALGELYHCGGGVLFPAGGGGGGLADFGDGAFEVFCGEKRVAGDEGVRARFHAYGGGFGVDAAVYLQAGAGGAAGARALVQGMGDVRNFVPHFGYECLPAESGIDGHDQDEVNFREEMFDKFGGGSGVEGDSRLHFHFADGARQAVGMAGGFRMKSKGRGPGIGERADEIFGVFGHQVDVEERARGGLAQGGAQGRAESEVGDELIVHHVQVQPVGAGGQGAPGVAAELGEVGGQQGCGDDGLVHG